MNIYILEDKIYMEQLRGKIVNILPLMYFEH